MRFKDYCYKNIIEKNIFKELDDKIYSFTYLGSANKCKRIINQIKNQFLKNKKYNIYNCTELFITQNFTQNFYNKVNISFELYFYNLTKINIIIETNEYEKQFTQFYFRVLTDFMNILLSYMKKIKEYRIYKWNYNNILPVNNINNLNIYLTETPINNLNFINIEIEDLSRYKYKKYHKNDFRNFVYLFKEYPKLKKIILYDVNDIIILTFKRPFLI